MAAPSTDDHAAAEAATRDAPSSTRRRHRGPWLVAAVLGGCAALTAGYLTLRGQGGDAVDARGADDEPALAAREQPSAPPEAATADRDVLPAASQHSPDGGSASAAAGVEAPATAGTETPASEAVPVRPESTGRERVATRRPKPAEADSPRDDPPAPAPTAPAPTAPRPKKTGVTSTPPPSLPLGEDLVPPPAPRSDSAPAKPQVSLDATATVVGFQSSGPLTQSAARRAIDRAESRFRGCYQTAAKRAGKNAKADVSVRLVIDEGGRSRDVEVGAAPLPGLSACLEGALADVRSRTHPDVGSQRIAFTVRFAPVKQ